MPACAGGARPIEPFRGLLEWLPKTGLETNVAVLLQSKGPLAWASLATELIDVDRLCAENMDPPEPFTQDDFLKFHLTLSAGPLAVDTPLVRKAINWLRYQEFLRVCECLPPAPPSGGMCPWVNASFSLSPGSATLPIAYDIPQSIYDAWPVTGTLPNQDWKPVYQESFSSHSVSTTQHFLQWSSDQTTWHIFAEIPNTATGSRACAAGTSFLPPPRMPRTGFVRAFNNSAVTFALTGFNYCFCGLSAAPPPIPIQPDLPGVPVPPARTCSDQDICDALNELSKRVTIISKQLQEVQRYGVPFEYIRGAVHSGQQLAGSFAISRLLGMQVDITQHQPGRPDLEGNPPYVWDQGWMSIMTADGMIEEKRISQSHMVWLPRLMDMAVTFGFELFPGTVATFTELQAEP